MPIFLALAAPAGWYYGVRMHDERVGIFSSWDAARPYTETSRSRYRRWRDVSHAAAFAAKHVVRHLCHFKVTGQLLLRGLELLCQPLGSY